MQFIGIYLWSKQLDNESTTRVKTLKFHHWLLTISSCFILSCIFYYEIPLFSKYLTSKYLFKKHSMPHLFDAITNSLNVIGQFLLIACYWEQYVIWTIVNLLSILMYSGKLRENIVLINDL